MRVEHESLCFAGRQLVLSHESETLGCSMRLGLFLPPQAEKQAVPVLLYLSGLTCTWENVSTKGFAQRACAEQGLAFLAPDTSPRGDDIPDDDAYDLGQGAGFYLDATQEPWQRNFRMQSYIEQELLQKLAENSSLPLDTTRLGITGHSMGGHGALTHAFRHPQRYRSLSAFAPIVAPSQCAWGQKAFKTYLGEDKNAWLPYDACELAKTTAWDKPLLVDQGTADDFLEEQLKPRILEQACRDKGIALTLRLQQGYDHSYNFIATFMAEHVSFHAQQLA